MFQEFPAWRCFQVIKVKKLSDQKVRNYRNYPVCLLNHHLSDDNWNGMTGILSLNLSENSLPADSCGEQRVPCSCSAGSSPGCRGCRCSSWIHCSSSAPPRPCERGTSFWRYSPGASPAGDRRTPAARCGPWRAPDTSKPHTSRTSSWPACVCLGSSRSRCFYQVHPDTNDIILYIWDPIHPFSTNNSFSSTLYICYYYYYVDIGLCI